MKVLFNILLLARPVNGLITAVTVIAGGFLLTRIPEFSNLVFASVGAALIAGFGNAVNDCIDIETDRINKPGRPIASGRLTAVQGAAASIVYLIAGLVVAVLTNIQCFIIALIAAGTLFIYSMRLKRVVALSNVVVSAAAAGTFVYAVAVGQEWAWEQSRLALTGAVFSFLYQMGREILKDAEDVEGDRAAGIKTIPIVLGIRSSLILSISTYLILFLVMLAAYFLLSLGAVFLIGSILLSLAAVCVVALSIMTGTSPGDIAIAQTRLKILMPCGLVLLLIARLSI
jgi:geranylgeranylglycerol-phosphate geranylgeranyltransferase